MQHALLTVDLSAIAANYRLLAQTVHPAACAAVVKANAYGLGMPPIARALHGAGCTRFYVAVLDEAIALRAILPDPAVSISVFHGLPDDCPPAELAELFLTHHLTPVLNSADQAALWSEAMHHPAAQPRLKDGQPSVTLHVDTGMHRLGNSLHIINDVEKLSTELRSLPVSLMMSHLACPDTPEHPLNEQQRQHVTALRSHYPDIPFSLSSSSGIFLGTPYHGDEVRPGAALYGINPTPAEPNPMQNVVTLSAPILQQRTMEEDGSVGYGASATRPAGSRLAVIGLGYADGILRCLSNCGTAIVHHTAGSTAVPFVGRVSMDLITLDVSAIPEKALTPESTAELIGPAQPVEVLASAANTIGYELFTRLGTRLRRDYIT